MKKRSPTGQPVSQTEQEARHVTQRLQIVLQQVTCLLDVEVGAVYLVEGSRLNLVAQHGIEPTWRTQVSEFALEEQSAAQAVSDGWQERAPIALQTRMIQPLCREGVDTGVVVLASSRARAFSDQQIHACITLIEQMVIAVQDVHVLQESQRQARRVLDNIPSGLFLLGADYRVMLANPAAREYLHFLSGVQVGDKLTSLGKLPVAQLLSPPPQGLWHDVQVDVPYHRIFETSVQPVHDGAACGWVVVMRDVTEERAVQEQMEQRDRLAAVGQLAAGIAHDFNNMLTVVMLNASFLLEDPEIPPSAKADLALIRQEGDRASQLTRQILDFGRRSATQRRPMSLSSFLKETIKLLKRTIPEHIRIESDIPPDKYMVSADPTKIQQVLTNLAVNARDAMPDGGVLQFRLTQFHLDPRDRPPLPGMAPGAWVAFAVSDTGTGIPDDVLPHIYEPFFTTKSGGTGLGLAQVYGIVGQHEGHIDVDTQAGVGTTFTIYLPVFRLEKAMPRAQIETAPRGHGETILLVEDDAVVLKVTRKVLENLGYNVLTATDGQEGIQVYNRCSDQIALVLTDVVMPRMSGEEMLAVLKKGNPDLKAIALTGYVLQEQLDQLLAQGIAARLSKPIDRTRLAQIVRQTLDE